MSNDYLIYLQEIPDASWMAELISEQFDNALDMMTPNSIVYGGAVRDCLAGKKLLGDLDIIALSTEHYTLIDRFIKSPKWVLINRFQKRLRNGPQKKTTDYKPFNLSVNYKPFNPFLPVNDNHVYKNSKISGATSFKTLGNKTVQIMELPVTKDTPFQTAINFAKQVDMVCCGVILTSNGRVFEIVPNAYEDCKKGILHFNNTFDVDNLEKFQSRIKKLVARGWHDNINMAQVIKNTKKKHRQHLKQKNIDQLNKRHTTKSSVQRFNYAKNEATTIHNDDIHIE